jgi:NTP pyrophosphatase (non-canonical NTP hydrolase)
MDETFDTIGAWAAHTFGCPLPELAAARANEEMAEMLKELALGFNDKADIEAADVVIVLSHYARSRGIDLQKLINEKMAVNRARDWAVSKHGIGYHKK